MYLAISEEVKGMKEESNRGVYLSHDTVEEVVEVIALKS